MHRRANNPSGRPRFLTNGNVRLAAPMRFDRPQGDFSLVERATLRALGLTKLEWAPDASQRGLVPPPPQRDAAEREVQRELVKSEKRRLAAHGYTWPTMADDDQWDYKRDMSAWRRLPGFKATAAATSAAPKL